MKCLSLASQSRGRVGLRERALLFGFTLSEMSACASMSSFAGVAFLVAAAVLPDFLAAGLDLSACTTPERYSMFMACSAVKVLMIAECCRSASLRRCTSKGTRIA